MKGCAKVIILLMSNRTRTIKSLPLIAVLFTCVVILSSAAIFASEEFTPSSEVSSELDPISAPILPEEYKDPVFTYLASGEAVRASYTVSDVYVLLNSALVGESNSSTYSLPRIAAYTFNTSYRLLTTNSRLSDILHAIVDGDSSNIPVGPGIRQMLYGLDGSGNWETQFDVSQDSRDLLQLVYSSAQQIHADGQNSNFYLSQISSNLSSYNWLSTNSTYYGISSGLNTTYLSAFTSAPSFVGQFNIPSGVYNNTPSVLRVFLSLQNFSAYTTSPTLSLSGVYVGNDYKVSNIPDYFIESTKDGIYIYLFGFEILDSNQRYSFMISSTSDYPVKFWANHSGHIEYIPFDTDDYQLMKTAFYQAKAANAQGSMASDVNRLANYLADPDKVAAEQASQQVIDDTLDGFTGNGSAAAKTSDTGSMKNMSGSIQSGLDSGASASNAASVFSNQTFWSWFTQSTSNGINNPYPAPVVQNTRGSGDDVPDFLSGNQAELNDLLNQRNSW